MAAHWRVNAYVGIEYFFCVLIKGIAHAGFANLVSLDETVTPALATYRFDYPITAADIGNLNLEARATDNQGSIGFSDLVQLSVITGAIPEVEITSPADGNRINPGEILEISIEASDADTDGF